MCGVVGVIGSPNAATEVFLGLTTLQHRGQDAAGILTYDSEGFHRVKNVGLVESVFTRENMKTLTGSIALGHTRYSTIGRGALGEVQPFLLNYPFGIGMVHNGNMVNYPSEKEHLLKESRRKLLTHSDTELILNVFADGLSKIPQDQDLDFAGIRNAAREMFKRVEGSFSLVSLIADHGLVAFRDPHGIRPLVWGKRKLTPEELAEGKDLLPKGEAHLFASESVALGFLGYDVVRELKPGEVVFIDHQGNIHAEVIAPQTSRPCMFEWVYFASPESSMENTPVYGARIGLGRELGRKVKGLMDKGEIRPDLIVPVPETSRIAAIALSEEIGVPYREVLIKNRYIKRTFILDSQEKRQRAVHLKLSPVRSEIEGKCVLLVDDSIVRGTTSQKIVELVRQAGAKEVYFVSTCPPIQHPCYYGIDFPLRSELVASQRSEKEIQTVLGVDRVIYQDDRGLVEAIRSAGDLPADFSPCMACINGKYPTPITDSKRMAEARNEDRGRQT